MKFLLIANNDSDGVGQVAVNLGKELNLLGHDAKTVVLNKKYKNKKVFKLRRSFIKRVFAQLINLVKVDLNELFGFGIGTVDKKDLSKYIENSDVIIIYTFYKIFSLDQLNEILRLNKKIFLRPLDIEMASGGCHFNMNCSKYTKDCDNCHKIKLPFKFIPKHNLLKKKQIINKYKPKLLVQNNYVKKLFDKSSIFKNIEKNVLYIGANKRRSNIIGKFSARKKLNLNNDEKIILFATFDLSSYVKGGHLLTKALKILDRDKFSKKNKITLLTLGKKNSFSMNTSNIKWRHYEPTSSSLKLNQLFRSSDLMVCPSLFCFGPHIIEEALLNKIPVVAFNGGSSQDFIKNGKNGYLVEKYNINQFANSIKKILEKKFYFDDSTHKTVNTNCNPIHEAKKLIEFCSEEKNITKNL